MEVNRDKSAELVFKEWTAKCYDASAKKWLHGHLKLATDRVIFTSSGPKVNCASNKQWVLHLRFTDVKSIDQAMSSIVFPAILLKTITGDSHWFSSFSDRNETFYMIDHFFKASLSSRGEESGFSSLSSQCPAKRTQLGTKLLSSACESASTLREAAANLSHQGEQLAGMACTMQDTHEDLTVMERIASGLNSWLGRWRMPKPTKADNIIMFKDHDIPDVLDVECLYTKISSPRPGPQMPGVCRVSAAGVTVLNLKQGIIHHFKWAAVSRVRGVSPWELSVTQFLIGQHDLSYNIVSVHMSQILRYVVCFAGSKLEYMELQHPSTSLSLDTSSRDTPVYHTRESEQTEDISFVSSHPDARQQQQQVLANKTSQSITNAEVDELVGVLNSIKGTALAISTEQDSQAEVIDNLTSSVTRADDRIKAVNKKMNKLLN